MMKSNLLGQKGTTLIIALLILLVLTLIGISSISTTTYEISISGNERVAADAFYASEAGIQVGIHQLPDNKPIAKTQLKEHSYYWGGTSRDEENPKSSKSFGLYPMPGFDASWAFKRFQVNATGKSLGAVKEIEVQLSYGPFGAGTQYHD